MRKWPSEAIPDIKDKGMWSLLSRSFACNGIVFVTHYAICTEFLLKPTTRNVLQRDTVMYELTQPHGTYCFLILLSLLTCVYAVFYQSNIASIKNKLRYMAYWFRGDITHYTDITPRMYILYMLSSLAAIWYGTFLFGAVFIFLLPKWIHVHKGILYTINDEGEIE